MSAVHASVICIAGAICCMVLRQQRPELAAVTAIGAGVAALLVCMEDIRYAVGTLSSLMQASGMSSGNISVMLRACGVAMVSEFATQICQDAGESALAGRIRLALRLGLTVMAAPMLADILSQGAALLQY